MPLENVARFARRLAEVCGIDFDIGEPCDCGVCDMRGERLIDTEPEPAFHPGNWL